MRSDHASKSKCSGVCIYYKEALPLRVININHLNECIRFELKIGKKLYSFISLYRSPGQTQDEFDKFTNYFELNLDLDNPYLAGIYLLKVNNRNTRIRCETCSKLTIKNILYSQISDIYSSWVDLIFTSQLNLVVESVVHPSLHSNCHHQITRYRILTLSEKQ